MQKIKALLWTMTLMASLSAHADPMLRLFELGIAPGQRQAFYEAGLENLSASVGTEPGTLAMYALSADSNPDLAYLVEIYAGPEAYQAHVAGAPYKAYAAKAPALLIAHRKLIETEAVFLAEKPAAVRRVNAERTPVVRWVEVRLKPQTVEAFRRIVVDEMAQSMAKEPGVLAMYAATRAGQPEAWYFIELYADEQAYEAHRQTPHFQAYLRDTEQMVAEKAHKSLNNLILIIKGGLRFQKD